MLVPVPETATRSPDPVRVSVRPDGMAISVKISAQVAALLAPVIEALACVFLPVYPDSTGHTATSPALTVIQSVAIS